MAPHDAKALAVVVLRLARLGAPHAVILQATAALTEDLWAGAVVIHPNGSVVALANWDGRDGWCVDLAAACRQAGSL